MTASEARGNRAVVRRISAACGVDERTVRAALDGWRGRSSAYQRALDVADIDLSTVPVRTAEEQAAWAAERKAERDRPRRAPPVDVDAAVAEAVAEWEGVSHGQTARIEELEAIIVGLRARVAELEAAQDDPHGGPAHSFVDRDGKLQVAPGYNVVLTGLTADDDREGRMETLDRLIHEGTIEPKDAAAILAVEAQPPAPPARLAVVPRERIVTIEMPDGTLATG